MQPNSRVSSHAVNTIIIIIIIQFRQFVIHLP